MSALAKDDGIDEDMAEMINFEIGSLSSQIQELEEKLMVHFTRKIYAFMIQSTFHKFSFLLLNTFIANRLNCVDILKSTDSLAYKFFDRFLGNG